MCIVWLLLSVLLTCTCWTKAATIFFKIPSHGEYDDGPGIWIQGTNESWPVILKDKTDPVPTGNYIDYASERALEWIRELSDENHDNETESQEYPMDENEMQENQNWTSLFSYFNPNITRDEIRSLQGENMAKYMDWTIDPCHDFYQYACGNWDLHNSIPDDAAAFDTFEKLRDQLNIIIRYLLEEPKNPTDTSAIIKVKDLYRSCMDQDTLEKRKEEPLMKLLQDLGDWPMISSQWSEKDFNWVELLGQLRLFNNDIFISLWIGPDGKNSDNYIIQLDQGDLGLPSREYFMTPINETAALQAYLNFIRGAALSLGGQEII